MIGRCSAVWPVTAALHGGSSFARRDVAVQRWDDNELGMMEAVVTKMSRIVAHVGIGERGKHVVQQLQVSYSNSPGCGDPF